MSSPIISIRNIGKKYKLGATISHDTLRDYITHGVKRIVEGAKGIAGRRGLPNHPITQSPNNSKDFWALKDISFDVNQGEVVGIIGRNGAGKSTLLKILSQITEPTEGEIRIRGRVASLLEVGTGFHPELSGRENVYMNGSILGMTKAEIDAKFNEIVAFAEVDKFIDTPIKRYSSGMNVRLAFAVAAYLEPEILLVDEVLAVGDVNFQQKCLGRMSDVTQEGRTVLFVSHNMQAIRQLTPRCILLENGNIVYDGNTNVCISKYIESVFTDVSNKKDSPRRKPSEERPVCIQSILLGDGKGNDKSVFSLGEALILEIEIESISTNIMLYATAHIKSEYGIYVYHLVSRDTGQDYFYSDFYLKVRMTLPKLLLYPGKYSIDLYVSRADSSLKNIDKILSAISFEVNQSAGLAVSRELGNGLAVVHEVPTWEIEDKNGDKYFLKNTD